MPLQQGCVAGVGSPTDIREIVYQRDESDYGIYADVSQHARFQCTVCTHAVRPQFDVTRRPEGQDVARAGDQAENAVEAHVHLDYGQAHRPVHGPGDAVEMVKLCRSIRYVLACGR